MCPSQRWEGKNPKNAWLNDMVKDAFERMKILGARYEVAKERCMVVYEEEKEKG